MVSDIEEQDSDKLFISAIDTIIIMVNVTVILADIYMHCNSLVLPNSISKDSVD